MSNKQNKYLVQGSILAVSSILARLIGMLYRIPLNRIVGDTGMGYYSMSFEIYNLALLLSSYSIPLAVSKLVSIRDQRKEYKNSYRIFLSAMALSASAGLIASATLFFGAKFWAGLIGGENAADIAIPLRVLAPTIFIFSIMGVLRGLFQGKRTMVPTAISQLLEQIVNAIVSIVAAYYLMKEHNASVQIDAYGAAGSTAGTLAGAIFGLLFLAVIYQAYHPILKKKCKKDQAEHQESYKEAITAIVYTALPVIISQTVFNLSGIIDAKLWSWLAEQRGILKEQSAAIFGIYSTKYKMLTTVPIAISAALGTAIVPTIAMAHQKEDKSELHNKIAMSVKMNMLIAFPSAIGLTVLAKPIVLLLFGYKGDVELSAELIRLGSMAVVLFALSTITNGVLQGIDRMMVPVKHAAISLVIHIPFVYLLIIVGKLDAYGLVIGNMSFALVVCILNWIKVAKVLNYKQEVMKTFGLPFAASVTMGIVTYFAYEFMHRIIHSNTISVLFSIIVAVIVYFISIILLRTMDEEELLEMPAGKSILQLCKKLHLL